MKLQDLQVYSLDNIQAIRSISIAIDSQYKLKKKNFTLLIDDAPAYPNVCVPLSALMDYFSKKDYL